MERSQYIVDRCLYSDDIVARAAHRYTGQFGVELRSQSDGLSVVFSALGSDPLPSDLSVKFSRDLLDERLRAAVRTETAGLQQKLIKAALLQAEPSVIVDVKV